MSRVESQKEDVDDGIWDLNEIEEKVVKASQWGTVAAKTFKAFSVSHSSLPAGCYSISKDMSDDRIIFVGKYIKSDKIMRFEGDMADDVLKEIDDFWNRGEAFKAHGFLHRRGYLLYGPQGTGKSSIVWQVAQDVIKRGGIVFVCDNPKFFAEGLKIFRQVESTRPLVCVFEDIDAIIKKYAETEILSLLDGDSQVDRVINIATTNYPELLDPRIVSRPRRFDRIFKINTPDESLRRAFFSEKLPKGAVELWVKKTKGLSFAGLAETLISVLCLENNLNDTVKILRDIETNNLKSSDFGAKQLGYSEEDEDDDDDGDSTKKLEKEVRAMEKKLGLKRSPKARRTAVAVNKKSWKAKKRRQNVPSSTE